MKRRVKGDNGCGTTPPTYIRYQIEDNTIRNIMLVASDLNGTLTTGSPILALVAWVRRNQPERYPKLYKYRILLSYLQVRIGMEALDQWANTMMREVLTLIEFPNQELLAWIMDDIVERELWPKRRQKAVDLLQQYHQQGAGIILVSAAYQPAVDLFSRKVAKERIIGIGTPVMLRDNQLILAETLTTGQEKLQRVKKVAGSKTLEIAMGDTASDIPLLEHSLHPIAVYPDRELKQYAQAKGWKILE